MAKFEHILKLLKIRCFSRWNSIDGVGLHDRNAVAPYKAGTISLFASGW